MPTNKQGQSDIVTHQTNILHKVSTTVKGFFITNLAFANSDLSHPRFPANDARGGGPEDCV
jgi:hypothetical protein